jgi:hypothetical protein
LINGGKRSIRQQWRKRYKSKLVKYIYYINYEYFANMKGTIYGNRLPRGTTAIKDIKIHLDICQVNEEKK